MKYLTHMVLFQLSREVKPNSKRERRDSFGLDSASCWCCALTTSPPAIASSHVKSAPAASQQNHHQRITYTDDIELHSLPSPKGKSRAIEEAAICEERPAAWPLTRPQMAHCRPRRLSSSNNLESNLDQISPLSK